MCEYEEMEIKEVRQRAEKGLRHTGRGKKLKRGTKTVTEQSGFCNFFLICCHRNSLLGDYGRACSYIL